VDLRYINPFVASAVSVIREAVGLSAQKKQIYITKGKESFGGVSIFFNITGDVEGQIIFDLPPGISTVIAREMIGLNLQEVAKDNENKDLFKSAITELGNMISGSAITKLEEHQYNCDITPPQVYVGPKTKLTHASMNTIVIEMDTQVGDFSINLVNKKDLYLDNITMLLVNTDQVVNTAILNEFIPKGFYIYHSKQLEPEAKYYLKEKNMDFVLVDVDSYNDKMEANITSLRETSQNERTKFMIYSGKKDPEFLKRVQNLAISGFILKDNSSPQVISKLQTVLARLGVKISDKRKLITVKATPDDKYKINIKLPNSDKHILGLVSEIGVASVIFQPESPGDTENFKVNMELKEIQLNLKGKIVLVDGVVISVKHEEMAIRFAATKDKHVEILSQVVFDKTSSF